MKRVIEFYGNVFILDAIMAITQGSLAKKSAKARFVTLTLRPQPEFVYNPEAERWELIWTGTQRYDIHFGSAKEAAEGLLEMKRAWEEAINVVDGEWV
ncbi:MAG: hypothetical protein JJE55_14085 [Flavobacteriaceae bacterium]|nr:hypothetical protein [Flavobacteriaceae bacterium]